MDMRKNLEEIMRNRVKTIIDSKGKVVNRYDSQVFMVKDIINYLSELGYSPKSKATIKEENKYYVYLIDGQKYVVKKELDGVSFYKREY